MLEPATTAIFSTPVGKLPIVERRPALPAVAGTAAVNIAPVASEPTAASSFRIAGDLSPVIFGPAGGRAVAVYKRRKGGAIPTVPAASAAAGSTSGYRKRILLSSLYFCHGEEQEGSLSEHCESLNRSTTLRPTRKIVISQPNLTRTAIPRRNR